MSTMPKNAKIKAFKFFFLIFFLVLFLFIYFLIKKDTFVRLQEVWEFCPY